MKSKLLVLALLVVIVGVAIAFRELFPKRELSPVRIQLQVDTVERIDTLWRTQLVTQTDTLWLERVTVQKPETVYRAPPLTGAVAVQVGKRLGDTTKVYGFDLTPLDSGYRFNLWESAFYTAGPVEALMIPADGYPRIKFGKPVKHCGSWCTLKHYATGGAIAAGVTATACMLTR